MNTRHRLIVAAGAVLVSLLTLNAGAAPARLPAVLHTQAGSVSFDGESVLPGETSAAQDVVISNTGDRALAGLRAEAHGDFVILRNTCVQALSARGAADATCRVAVAFRPQADGARSGDLTLTADDGALQQVVALSAGTPVIFPSVPPGGTSTQWVVLPANSGALTATAQGPIAIALQTSYRYDSIDGIAFGSSASSNGQCAAVTPCQVYLGIRSLPSAPAGQTTASVTLSTGISYRVTLNVLGAGVSVSPSVVDGGTLYVQSRSEPKLLTITNDNKTAITLAKPVVSGPFSATSGCGASLEAGASCSVQVFFSPMASGASSGALQVASSVGPLAVTLSGTGLDNPAGARFNPGTLDFAVPQPAAGASAATSAPRTLSITNRGTTSLQIGAPSVDGADVSVVVNHCTTLAPQANCQIKFEFVGDYQSDSRNYHLSTIHVPATPAGGTTFTYELPTSAHDTATPPPVTHSFSVFPTALQFPGTPFGRSSAGRVLTVTNTSSQLLAILATSDVDFAVEPGCYGLLPGKSCQLAVHYVPTVGNSLASGNLTLKAVDLTTAYLTDFTDPALDSATVTVTGASVNPAALKSPAAPPLVQPVDNSTGAVDVTNQSAVPLKLTGISPLNAYVDCPAGVSPFAIGQGESCAVTPFSSHFSLSTNAVSSPDVFSLTAVGGSISTSRAAPNVVSLSPLLLGDTISGTVTVSIASSIGADTTRVLLYPELNDNFTVSNQCPASLQSVVQADFVDYYASCNVVVAFTPKTLGFHSGALGIVTDSGVQTVLLSGTAVAPAIAVGPAELDFSVHSGVVKTSSITLENNSGKAVSLAAPLLTGPQSSAFTLGAASCGTSLGSGASCSIAVTYSTPSSRSYGTVLVTTAEGNTLGSVLLRGAIVELLSYPSSYDEFSASTPGVQEQTTFTVRSQSGTPITLGNTSISGSGAAAFAVSGGTTCASGLVLENDDTCSVVLQWTSRAYGEVDFASVNVATSAGTLAIAVSGATNRQ